VDKRFTLALKYYEASLPGEAWEALRDAAADPGASSDVLGLAATLRLEAGDFEQAVALCERLLVNAPTHLPAWLWKAQALFRAGRTTAAEHAMASAFALPGKHPAGWNNLGNLLDELGRPRDAQAALNRAIEQAPDFSPAHNNLGTVLAGQGRYAAAAAAHRQALDLDPRNLAAMNNLGVALLEQGCAREAVVAFDRVLAADPSMRDAADNRLYAEIYRETDHRAIHALHAAWGKNAPAVPALRPIAPDPERRLRVGYVSPDFRRHSLSFFVEPVLAAHDATAVEVFCYADVVQGDAVTARIKAAAHHWRDSYHLRDEALLSLIREDRIDILVDLAGHTKGNRLAVFARRAAPVQVTAWGYPATTGLPAMDYRLCDGITDPATEADAWAVESLVRLVPGLHCYAPPADAPPVGPLPALAAEHITFGSFNKLAKISPETVALWSAALKAVPGSRLLLKTKPLAEDETRARIAQMFAGEGIEADRLDLRGWIPGDRGHLDLYNQIDIALDTVPYNGTTTTCEALWMGVPVLTVVGRSHAARVGASLLSQANMAEWVVPETAFAARAAGFAGHLGALDQLRRNLRADVAASPLCDATAHARGLESAYRAMWRKAAAVTGSSAD
jgi:predicted O-linked N-acetylglucosamine transferase (SPINDLY family)